MLAAMKTLITNGTIITSQETLAADLLLADGRVAAIGAGLDRDGADIVNASGKYILPGGVDVHTHITLNIDAVFNTDAFYTGTIPAITGGTTTVIDHMSFAPEGRSFHDHIALYKKTSEKRPVVDYGFHGLIQHMDAQTLAELVRLPEQEFTSVKAYMTYPDRLNDAELSDLLRLTKKLGLLLAVHCENHEEIIRLRAEFKAEGKGEPIWHARSRPAECEAEAVSRLLRLASEAGDAPVYVVHLSTAKGLNAIQKARAAGQKNIFAETCTQYLTLTEDKYLDPDTGLLYLMSPPLRTRKDTEALWEGVANGDIQTIATDHCSFTLADKAGGRGDFTLCPGGAPGMEERMTVLFSEGVMQGRISATRFVDLVSTTPARLFGLFPQKGDILPGSDADVVILDPEARYILQNNDLHGPSDYSLYEGMTLTGRIDAVYLRGVLMADQTGFLGKRGAGQLLRRGRCMYSD